MKNLIKLFIVVIAFTMTTETFAQTFGIKGGLNMSNMLVKDDDDTYSDDFKMNPGFHVGVTAEFPMSDMFSFETGVLLSTKGFKIDEEITILGETMKTKGHVTPIYIEIPLTAKTSFDFGGAKIYGLFGPYLGMGIGGKSKTEVTILGITETEEDDINWGSGDDDDFKPLDFGLTVGAGIEINAIQIGLSYGLGLANISTSTDNGAKINNRVLGISLGYRFVAK